MLLEALHNRSKNSKLVDCLCCQRPFKQLSRFNKICDRCHNHVDGYEPRHVALQDRHRRGIAIGYD